MRDLMAITERPEVISLAGGLPDTSTFPPESFAAIMSRVAAESCARALQYGPTEGHARSSRRASPRSWPRRARSSTPTTSSSRPAASRSSTSSARRSSTPATSSSPRRRPTPARSRRSAPTRPTSCRSRMDADGMRIDELEATLDRLEREGRRPKFIYTIPTFQNPAGVTMSLPRRQRLVEVAARARAARARGQPVRPAALRGRPAADAALARRRRVRHLPRHVLEDPLAGHPARLGRRAAAGAREDERRQAGRRPVLVVDDAVLRRRVLRARRAGRTTSTSLVGALPRAGAT